MKKRRFIKIMLLISLIVISIFCFQFALQPQTEVLKAECIKNYNESFTSDYYINFENRKYLIKEVFKYKNGMLNEYWFTGSEGFAVQKFEIRSNNYSNEQKPYKFLRLNIENKSVEFNSSKYTVNAQKADTIISKIDSTNIIVFIRHK